MINFVIMALVLIPYDYKNGVRAPDSIAIETNNFELCGEKYFELRILSVVNGYSNGTPVLVTSFSYKGDIYSVESDTISSQDLIYLINNAFSCPLDCNCDGQDTTFDYELTASQVDAFYSDKIVEDVGGGNAIYAFTSITINGTPYPTATIWDDAIVGEKAADKPFDYIAEIISYLESLSIPQYKGAFNRAVNDMADNYEGDNLLELYFTSGTTVVITISINAAPSGSFGGMTTKTIALSLEFTDTSTLSPSDSIVSRIWSVSDGQTKLENSTNGTILLPVYTIQGCGYNLDTTKGWVLNEVIRTENGCTIDNLATAVILPVDIEDCITNGTIKTGSGS